MLLKSLRWQHQQLLSQALLVWASQLASWSGSEISRFRKIRTLLSTDEQYFLVCNEAECSGEQIKMATSATVSTAMWRFPCVLQLSYAVPHDLTHHCDLSPIKWDREVFLPSQKLWRFSCMLQHSYNYDRTHHWHLIPYSWDREVFLPLQKLQSFISSLAESSKM